MIRRILTPLDPSPYGKTALEYSCYVASKHQAEVTGIVVLDLPGIEKSIGPVAAGALYWAEKLEKFRIAEAQTHIKKLLNNFNHVCTDKNIAHSEAKVQGSPSEQIIFESIFYDLVVMGLRTYYHFETDEKYGNTLDKVLNNTITPILAVPEKFTEIRKVLIAFDGSFPAVRALQRFTHLAANYDLDFEIKILMSDSDREKAHYYLDHAKEYLSAYKVQRVKKEWTADPVIDAMKNGYLEWADLIVCGVHSRNFLKDFLVGSLVKFLINEGSKPLFLGQ